MLGSKENRIYMASAIYETKWPLSGPQNDLQVFPPLQLSVQLGQDFTHNDASYKFVSATVWGIGNELL
jgi:hypothetical protein